MIKMEIKGLLMDPVSNMPVVILRDTEKGLFLPIWVGIFEANAIALEMEKVSTPRPMTHDLLKNLLAELDARVDRVVINDLRENTFFARIHLTRNDATLSDRQPAERRDRARPALPRRDLRRGRGAREEPQPARRGRPGPGRLRSGSRKPARTSSASTSM